MNVTLCGLKLNRNSVLITGVWVIFGCFAIEYIESAKDRVTRPIASLNAIFT